jgi:hypothetical protein
LCGHKTCSCPTFALQKVDCWNLSDILINNYLSI